MKRIGPLPLPSPCPKCQRGTLYATQTGASLVIMCGECEFEITEGEAKPKEREAFEYMLDSFKRRGVII